MTEPYRAIPFEEIVATWPDERRNQIAQRVIELLAEGEAARQAEARQPKAARTKGKPVKLPHSA